MGNNILFLSGMLGVLILIFIGRKKFKYKKGVIAGIVIFLIIVTFIPSTWLGKWNAIKVIGDKQIKKVEILPEFSPEDESNLVHSMILIENRDTINFIVSLLRRSSLYSAGKDPGTWYVKVLLLSEQNDSFFIELHKTQYQGMKMYTPDGDFRQDELGNYLEKIVENRN